MGPKKGRGGKVATVTATRSEDNHSEISNRSSISNFSFLEGLQRNYGKQLHSTAMEEDLDIVEEGQEDGRSHDPQTPRTTETRGAAVRSKPPQTRHGDTERDEPVSAGDGKLVGKKPAKLRRGQKSAVRSVKVKQVISEKKRSELTSGRSSDSRLQEECESDTTQQKRRKVLSSEEDIEDNDANWSPQKPKVYNISRTTKSSLDRSKPRKSSSGSTSADGEEASSSDHRKERRGHRGETHLDVVLDAFLDLCDKYRESVESKAVKQSIDSFSNNVKEQLLEKISLNKEFRDLKRENAKVGSLIHRKTQRLLDAKNELMRAERQVRLLQKEKADLELRLSDLRLGYAFLHDIRELNRQYLEYREKHRKEKETYGASSLPAQLLEQQLKGISNRLERN